MQKTLNTMPYSLFSLLKGAKINQGPMCKTNCLQL